MNPGRPASPPPGTGSRSPLAWALLAVALWSVMAVLIGAALQHTTLLRLWSYLPAGAVVIAHHALLRRGTTGNC